MRGRPQSALPPRVLPLASVSLSLSIFITPSFLSFLPFSFFLHSPPSMRPRTLSLCMCVHARRANAATHTPLCLYLIIGSITGEIFPDDATEGGEPGKAVLAVGGGCWGCSPLQNRHSLRMRRMNLIYFPFEAPTTYSNTLSFRGAPHIFPQDVGRAFCQRLIC